MLLHGGLLSRFYYAPDKEAGGGELTDDEVLNEGGGEVESEVESDAGVEPEAGSQADPDDETVEVETDDEPVPPSLSDVWKAHKISGLPEDPNELLGRFQRAEAAEREAQQMRNALLWQLHNQQQTQQQIQQWQAQQQQEKPKPIFDLPEYHPDWLQLVTQDENGNLIAKPGADPTLPQKIQAFAKAREAANIRLLQDPIGTLAPAFMPQVQQLAQQMVQQQLADYDRRQQLKNYERENREWIFANGKDGELTPAAQLWNQHYSQAQNAGLPDPIAYAHAMLDREVYKSMYESQVAETQKKDKVLTAKEKDRQFIKTAAAKQANRSGAQPNGTTKKSRPREDKGFPKNRLLQQLKALPDSEFENI